MKTKLLFIVLIILGIYCTPNLERDTIRYKSRRSINVDDSTCIYGTADGFRHVEFCAPCSWYDIGDSTNKWYKIANKKQ